MKVVALWTGGKDSALACYKAIKGGHKVAHLVTFLWQTPSSAHDLELIKLQSEALGIPFLWFKLEKPYFEAYKEAMIALKKEYGIEAIVTGDISYVDSFHGSWIDEVCEDTGIKVIKPLWGLKRSEILSELLSSGFKVIFTCVKQPWFSESWLGRTMDKQSVQELGELNERYGVDMCGEIGEYHTMTLDAPLFKRAIEISHSTKEHIGKAYVLSPTAISLANSGGESKFN
ncbi:MAG: diphthine--ammonia ligase [Candidatus Bathyarchaeota archaeon]|nr:diphthine--ammonia ligase [Candidatus Bathyarchaeota archaeon]